MQWTPSTTQSNGIKTIHPILDTRATRATHTRKNTFFPRKLHVYINDMLFRYVSLNRDKPYTLNEHYLVVIIDFMDFKQYPILAHKIYS